jgi:hypothetical protein
MGAALTWPGECAGVVSEMFDWSVQGFRNGQPAERPSIFTSAEAAIEAANDILHAAVADEVTVYHRLYSNQACMNFLAPIPPDEIRQKAAHLEKQAQRASKDG